MVVMDWLSQEGPTALKHRGWKHPIATCFIHYAVVSFVTFTAHDLLLRLFLSSSTHDELSSSCQTTDESSITRRYRSALWILPYSLWLLIWRLIVHNPPIYRNCVLYEYTWLCNVTLNLGAAGLLFHRPIIAAAYCVSVGIDQLTWYIDLSVYFLTGKFPFGVSKYIFWNGVSWKSRITSTHHLWTIPLLLYATQGMNWLALPLSMIIMVTNVLLSRWMTPMEVQANNNKDEEGEQVVVVEPKYLNVNLSHALWKDISIGLLQIDYDDPPIHVYLWRLFVRWGGFNVMVFGVLYTLCQYLFGQDSPIC